MSPPNVLALVLAGGIGTRLRPLTAGEATAIARLSLKAWNRPAWVK